MITKIENATGPVEGKTLGLLGLTFKPNTSDVRESPAVDIVKDLLNKGATIKTYDPEGMDEFKRLIEDEKLLFCKNAYEAAKRSEGLIFVTEWNEFRNIDLQRLKKNLAKPVILDLRNIFEPEKVTELGFEYIGVGRGMSL